ncbi:nucleotidyltransferase substrate binding protein [Candidatus Uhrbacteria bacterium]|nr:nucleotidyltransferase substrate binding protein [Candidatus Uhrbacteria bacterium]
MTKFISIMEDFEKALDRLEEALAVEKTEIVRDSCIKRFEIVFDLGWKTLKAFLQEIHNASCASPITCFREAIKIGLIEHDDFWLEVKNIRNLTIPTYNRETAEEVYATLPVVLKHFRELYRLMKKENS